MKAMKHKMSETKTVLTDLRKNARDTDNTKHLCTKFYEFMAAYLNYIFQRLRFKKLLSLCFTAINYVYCNVKVSIIIYN